MSCPAQMTSTLPLLAYGEEHFFVPGPRVGMRLFLRKLASGIRSRDDRRSVLYIHGATFPSALSVAHRFDGRSWRDALCDAGFDVWGLDFYGFGFSDRYPEMDAPADENPPLCLAAGAAAQIAAAVGFILEYDRLPSLSLIAHSWGSMAAGKFADYDVSPYGCAPSGYYGPEWFNGGVFIGAGPWFHGASNFRGNVNNAYHPDHGYKGAMPERGEKADAAKRVDKAHFTGNEQRDGRGHAGEDKR